MVRTKEKIPEANFEDKYLKRILDATKDTSLQVSMHQDALLNCEFLQDNQWVTTNKRGEIIEIPVDSYYKRVNRKSRPREIFNLMFPIWRTYKSYMLRAVPRIRAQASDPEDVYDLLASRVATKIMEYLYEKLVLEELAEYIINDQLIYGTVFLHPVWDKESRQCDLLIIPPTQIFPFPAYAKHDKEVKGVIWRRSVLTELLEDQYPGLEFKNDTDSLDDLNYYLKAGVVRKEPTTTIYDYWELPFAGSKGVFVRSTKTEVIEWSESFPYENEDYTGKFQLPFVRICDNKLNNSFYGFSTLSRLRRIQMAYNKGRSRLAQLRELLPKLIVDVEAKLKMNDLYDEDSTIIEYSSSNDAKPPQYTSVPVVNPLLVSDVMVMPSEMEHIAGFHEITLRSQAPGSIQSGTGVRDLRSQDENRLSSSLNSLRLGYMKMFNLLYSLVRQYYKDDQIKDILGERGEIDILAFKEIPLSPMTFKVEESSFSPFSRLYRQMLIRELLPLGIFNVQDPVHRQKLYEYLDPDLAMSFDTMSQEEILAKSENKQMLENETIAVNPDDNDAVHIRVINYIRKDVRFKDLSDTVKGKFDAHHKAHQEQGQQKMLAAIKMSQMTQSNNVQGERQAQANPASGA